MDFQIIIFEEINKHTKNNYKFKLLPSHIIKFERSV